MPRHLARLRLDPRRKAEIAEELAQHLDQRYEELCAGGATEAEARVSRLRYYRWSSE